MLGVLKLNQNWSKLKHTLFI